MMRHSNGHAIGAVTSAATGTLVSSNASANTKGSWAQIDAATPYDCAFAAISLSAQNTTSTQPVSWAVDIGVGASGSETAIVPNLLLSTEYANAQLAGCAYHCIALPLQIPAGTRIAARCQDSVGGGNVAVSLLLFDGAFTQMEGCAGVDAIGFTSASTNGTTITVSTTPGTKSAYSQLIAATARDYIGFFAIFDSQPSFVYGQAAFDIAIGASGSEVVIVPNCLVGAYDGGVSNKPYWPIGPLLPFVPLGIPAGTRIAARVALQSYNSSAGSGNVGITLYGVYK